MQAKKLTVYDYNMNISSKIIGRINKVKRNTFFTGLFIFLFFTLSFAFVTNFYKSLNCSTNRDISVADFKLDVNKLTEAASIIEAEKKSNIDLQISNFGSDGKILKSDDITPDLQKALANISDKNTNGYISEEELSDLKIMRLKPDVLKKKLNEFQFTLSSSDCNIKNYVVITQGKYAGTILYNGPLKFIDNEDKRYFGLELSN